MNMCRNYLPNLSIIIEIIIMNAVHQLKSTKTLKTPIFQSLSEKKKIQ